MNISETAAACPVCSERNDILAVRCKACGAYIRDRVPSIPLFHTLWLLLETPGAAFLRIARSEQKNYVFVLFALSGPFLAAVMLFAVSAGAFHPRFESILGILILWGIGTGLVANSVAALCMKALNSKSFRPPYRTAAALHAFSVAPLVFASVVLLPIDLAVFGTYFFFPLPQLYQPFIFWLLVSLHAACVLWSVYLMLRYQHVLGESNRTALLKTGLAFLVICCFIAGGGAAMKFLYFT